MKILNFLLDSVDFQHLNHLGLKLEIGSLANPTGRQQRLITHIPLFRCTLESEQEPLGNLNNPQCHMVLLQSLVSISCTSSKNTQNRELANRAIES